MQQYESSAVAGVALQRLTFGFGARKGTQMSLIIIIVKMKPPFISLLCDEMVGTSERETILSPVSFHGTPYWKLPACLSLNAYLFAQTPP